ncbi:M protein trans-acting positive regulator HTH domain protein [Enterococcus faecalis 13-SD-W-01]|nr:M protein trans-acting positive regulator HTH domain protein [Enterococcus faecalis 13-SD-W-01]
MQTFLTKTSLKKVLLLEYLLEKNNWCTMSELKKILRVTDKTILSYIEELTHLFQQYNSKIILKNDNNKQFRVQKEEDFPIYNIYLYFYRSSYNYNLINFMYNYPEKTIKDYAEEQFTSVSTVFRYAKLLRPYFERYRLDFQSFKLDLNADEISVRSFYYYFYWHSTRESNGYWPFKTELSKIESAADSFEEVYQISFDPFQKRVFSYWLTINLERSQVKKICIDRKYKKVADMDQYFGLLRDWAEKAGFIFEEDELYFLYRVIYAFGVIDGNKKYENSHALSHKKNSTCSYRAIQNMAKTLKSTFGFELDIADPELVFNFAAFHERSLLFYGNTDLFFNRSYVTEIKEEDPEAYQVMEDLRKKLNKTADKELSKVLENWEQLFLDYYYVLDYYHLFLKRFDPLKILVKDDLHHTHRLWLMNKIHSYFGHSYVFAFYDYKTKVSNVDLVISNYYLDTGETPLVLMKNIPTERNWRQLEEKLYELTKQKTRLH